MKIALVVSASPTRFAALALQADLAENLSDLARYGYDGVELAIRDPHAVDADALVALVRHSGLAVPAIGTGQAYVDEGLALVSPDPAIRRAATERILSHLPLASRLGAQVIIGLIRGRTSPSIGKERAWELMVEALRTCARAAETQGVGLLLEPLNRYETDLINTLAEGAALIEALGSRRVQLLADTFHMNIEEPSIEESLSRHAALLGHVHVADSNRWAPGFGHLDFGAILERLKRLGYDGYVSAEVMPLPDAVACARQAISHLRGLL